MVDFRYSGYTGAELTEVLDRLDVEGRAGYRRLIATDFGLALTYGTALVLLTARGLRFAIPDGTRGDALMLLPIGGMIADWVEGAVELADIAAYPDIPESYVRIGSAATSIKWRLLAPAFATPVALFAVGMIRRHGAIKP
ncbi:MAG: hypothetical protein NVSMB48_00250 [Marmoricola sp.]